MTDDVDCSVLTPVLNEERDIAGSVAAMRRQSFPGRLEFLLIDGGSSDRTPEILRRLAQEDPRIRLLANPRGAIPSGLNVGLLNARGRWVARMDAHSEYPPDYLAEGVSRLLRGGTRWVSGPQVPVGRGAVGRAGALALRTALGRGGSGRWLTGAGQEYLLDSGVFCGVWARETLLEYGGWDERWLRNEDSELAARFLENGERMVALPEMAATYRPRESLRSLWRQYLNNGFFRARTAKWHPITLRRSNLLPPALALACATALGAPRPVRRAARASLCGYGAVACAAGVGALADAEAKRDAALVPVVLAVMHIAYGLGFLRGVCSHGVPLAALGSAAGLRRVPPRWAPERAEVFAPSLRDTKAAGRG